MTAYEFTDDRQFVVLSPSPLADLGEESDWTKALEGAGWTSEMNYPYPYFSGVGTYDLATTQTQVWWNEKKQLWFFDVWNSHGGMIQVFCRTPLAAFHFTHQYVLPMTTHAQWGIVLDGAAEYFNAALDKDVGLGCVQRYAEQERRRREYYKAEGKRRKTERKKAKVEAQSS